MNVVTLQYLICLGILPQELLLAHLYIELEAPES